LQFSFPGVMPGPISPVTNFGIVILAGGSSSRMGSPKHLLPDADGNPIYLSQLRMLHETFPDAKHLCIIVRDKSQQLSTYIPHDLDVCVLSGETSSQGLREKGPATAISSISTFDDTCYWLTVPYDYPLLAGSELTHLCAEYRNPVTCFQNGYGGTEPLVAIWSPKALSQIDLHTMHTRDHLSGLIDRLSGTKITPMYDHSLFNANTREDWDDAIRLLSHSRLHNSADHISG
jgi:molybdopterin-guanine dinucleotide biosynthesis protein A